MSRLAALAATLAAISGALALAPAPHAAVAAGPPAGGAQATATTSGSADVTAADTGRRATKGPPVRLSAGFSPGAALGGATALTIGLRVDAKRTRVPVREVRLLYPRSLGLVSSGLGLAECRRPARDFTAVLVDGFGLDGCPPNSVMGYGTIVAEVRLSDGQVIPEYGTFALLSGGLDAGTLRLVIQIDGQRPFGGRLVLAGRVASARRPFGGAIAVRFPYVPALAGVAEIALTNLRLVVGHPRIRYVERVRGRIVRYRPEGIVLPPRCPRGGFRFRARLTFEDGRRQMADTVIPCSALARR